MTNREILLGVSGGVAAYKAADLCSKLVQAGAKVTAVMTPAATNFVGPTTFQALTGRPVYRDMFEPQEHHIGEHIGLARRTDLYVIAPATANVIGKIAGGLADDLVCTLALSVTCPVVVAPAMNNEMWSKPSVQRNVQRLRDDGLIIVDPAEGWLSCGNIGPGRMAEPQRILEQITQILGAAD